MCTKSQRVDLQRTNQPTDVWVQRTSCAMVPRRVSVVQFFKFYRLRTAQNDSLFTRMISELIIKSKQDDHDDDDEEKKKKKEALQ